MIGISVLFGCKKNNNNNKEKEKIAYALFYMDFVRKDDIELQIILLNGKAPSSHWHKLLVFQNYYCPSRGSPSLFI